LCGGLKDRAHKTKTHTQQEQSNIHRKISTVSGEGLQRQGVLQVNWVHSVRSTTISASAVALVSSYATFWTLLPLPSFV